VVFFFFQAEDGIRDFHVTGVQTCALPISLNIGVLAPLGAVASQETGRAIHFMLESNPGPGLGLLLAYTVAGKGMLKQSAPGAIRSEERRVGKECRSRWSSKLGANRSLREP